MNIGWVFLFLEMRLNLSVVYIVAKCINFSHDHYRSHCLHLGGTEATVKLITGFIQYRLIPETGTI